MPKGVRKVGQKYFGKCAICKKFAELSREHIPPRCAFNKGRYKVLDGMEVIKKGGLPWVDNKETNSVIRQGGYYKYSLCQLCNRKTGQFYANAYKDFVYILHNAFVSYNFKTNDLISIKLKIKPLNIIKQIISIFNTINPGVFEKHGLDIEKFLLNKENKDFCNDINFYIFLTKDGTIIPSQAICFLGNPKPLILSEMCHYPLGIIMTIDSVKDDETCCINNFLEYEYDEEVEMELKIYVRERNLTFVGDYRTKEELKNIVDDK